MGRGTGIRFLLARRASLLLVRHLCLTADDHCSARAAHQENPAWTGDQRFAVSPSAYCGRGIRLSRQPLRRAAEFCYRQRLFADRIQDFWNVDGGSQRKVLGGMRRYPQGMAAGGVFTQRKILPDRKLLLMDETLEKANSADLVRCIQRRNLDQDGRTGIRNDGNSLCTIKQHTRS